MDMLRYLKITYHLNGKFRSFALTFHKIECDKAVGKRRCLPAMSEREKETLLPRFGGASKEDSHASTLHLFRRTLRC